MLRNCTGVVTPVMFIFHISQNMFELLELKYSQKNLSLFICLKSKCLANHKDKIGRSPEG